MMRGARETKLVVEREETISHRHISIIPFYTPYKLKDTLLYIYILTLFSLSLLLLLLLLLFSSSRWRSTRTLFSLFPFLINQRGERVECIWTRILGTPRRSSSGPSSRFRLFVAVPRRPSTATTGFLRWRRVWLALRSAQRRLAIIIRVVLSVITPTNFDVIPQIWWSEF